MRGERAPLLQVVASKSGRPPPRCGGGKGRVRQAVRKIRPGLYVPDVRTVPRYGPQGGHQPSDTKYDDTRTATNRAGNPLGKAEESIVRALGTPCRHRWTGGGLAHSVGSTCCARRPLLNHAPTLKKTPFQVRTRKGRQPGPANAPRKAAAYGKRGRKKGGAQ